MIDLTKTGAEMFANAEVGEEVYIATIKRGSVPVEYWAVKKLKIARVLKTKVVLDCGREYSFKASCNAFSPSWEDIFVDHDTAKAANDYIKLKRRLKAAREKVAAMTDEKLLLILEAIEGG